MALNWRVSHQLKPIAAGHFRGSLVSPGPTQGNLTANLQSPCPIRSRASASGRDEEIYEQAEPQVGDLGALTSHLPGRRRVATFSIP